MQDRTAFRDAVAGRASRLRLNAGVVDGGKVAARLGLCLSLASPAPAADAWLDGLLSGDAKLLVGDSHLLEVVDGWITAVDETCSRTSCRFCAPPLSSALPEA